MPLCAPATLARAVENRVPLAEKLFDEIRVESVDVAGVTRPAWSSRDQAAADILGDAAKALGLEVTSDPAGNLWCTLPGVDRGAPRVLTGSHLDSVPTGGHFDGLAGAVAGLVALAAFRDLGVEPPCDLTAMGIRGEESVWYGIAYVGSRLAVGDLPRDDLDRLAPRRHRPDAGRAHGRGGHRRGCLARIPRAGGHAREHPGLPGASHRAGPGPGRRGPAGRHTHHDPGQRSVSLCSLHRELRPLRRHPARLP